MPCYEPPRERTPEEAKAYIDKLTRLLCEAGHVAKEGVSRMSHELRDWWRQHEIDDLARRAEMRGMTLSLELYDPRSDTRFGCDYDLAPGEFQGSTPESICDALLIPALSALSEAVRQRGITT